MNNIGSSVGSFEEHNKEHKKDSLEEKIMLLRIQIDEYSNLTDQDKIKNADKYNKITKEKDDCIIQLEKYKEMLISIDKNSKNEFCSSEEHNKEHNKDKKNDIIDDKLLTLLINNIHEIKTNSETPNIKLDELIKLYSQLTETKVQLDSYFQNKTMEIIKL